VGDGLLALSDKAQDRLPSFGLPPQSNAATGWLPLVTLEQLATHTAGFEKDGGYVATNFAPGAAFRYTDGGANWLGDVLTATFKQDLATVLRARVLNPIGVPASGLRWGANTYRPEPIGGATHRAINSTIYASIDTMARVGLMLARGGQWKTTQVVPQEYVRRAAQVPDSLIRLQTAADYEPSTPYPTQHYGLLWWNNADGTMPGLPTEAFWAWGLDDALIVVVPSLDLVIARHGPRIDPGLSGIRFGSYAAIKPFLSPIGRSVTRANTKPVVNAGPDLTLAAPGPLQIVGRFSDDGLPGKYSPVVTWSRVTGPAEVTFAPATRAVTTATFTAAGTYTLKLAVGDRSLKGNDTVKVTVKP
jgi:CubicO group peptidase (beta-lactamase class C family)